jgi:hypothetical protein
MNPKLIAVMALWKKKKHLSGVVSNLEPIPQCYGFMITSFDHLSIYATKTRTKIAYEYKAKRKLKQTKLKFSNKQNHKKKSYSKNNFSNYFTFSLTEINRTPRSLL